MTEGYIENQPEAEGGPGQSLWQTCIDQLAVELPLSSSSILDQTKLTAQGV
jgi:hypothetical protein